MNMHAILVILSTVLLIGSAFTTNEPGMGISLSSGYGYENHKRMHPKQLIHRYCQDRRRRIVPNIYAWNTGSSASANFLFFCKVLSNSETDLPTLADQSASQPCMLKALVTAAECTLEYDIPSVAVSTSRIPGHEMLREDVLSALDDLGVYGWNRLDQDAKQITYVLGLTGTCTPVLRPVDSNYRQDPEQLVMAIDYTRNSMTATLWAEDCGFFEQRGQVHSSKLGYDALEACRKTDNGSCDIALMTALRSVSKEQIETNKGILGSVLLFGEQANDMSMTTMLRQVLREQFANGESVDFFKVQELSGDLTFAASRAGAWLEWGRKRESSLRASKLQQRNSEHVHLHILHSRGLCTQPWTLAGSTPPLP